MAKTLTPKVLHAARPVLLSTGITPEPEKLRLMKELEASRITNVNVLLEYHDLLLFVTGYPDTQAIYNAARQGLLALRKSILSLRKKHPGKLDESGLVLTDINGPSSLALIVQLCRHFPKQIKINKIDTYATSAELHSNCLFPGVLRNELDNRRVPTVKEWLQENAGRGYPTPLHWLARQVQESPFSQEVKEYFYETFGVSFRWKLSEGTPCRTTAQSSERPIHFHSTPLRKKITAAEVFAHEKINKRPLTATQRHETWINSLCTLAAWGRETDTVTHCAEEHLESFDCGHGMDTVLFQMKPEMRIRPESYIGYMAFKNRVPLAYGGAWITGKHCRIGVNIFPWFRGGESAWTFLQLINTYRVACGATTFIAEPYQVGKDNSDGIKSGAFWFYYRLGFRPMQPHLAELAASEWEKINKNKEYRTSIPTLKVLADSYMLLNTEDGPSPAAVPDSQSIGKRLRAFLREQYNGRYQAALDDAVKKFGAFTGLSKNQLKTLPFSQVLSELLLLVAFAAHHRKFTPGQLEKICKGMLPKVIGSERDFIHNWQKNKVWNDFWERLVLQQV